VKRLLTVFAIAYTVARAVPYGHGLPLLSPWHVQYRTGMAFSLVVAHPAEGSTMLITRPGTAAPDSAIATAQLDSVGLKVRFRIRVDPGGGARVVELSVWPLAAIVRTTEVADGDGAVLPPGAITSRALRGIRLDELAREALRQVEMPAADRSDLRPGAFQLPGDPAGRTWYADPPPRRAQADLVATAARVYTAAVAAGSRAPTLAVAHALGYSRSQASRLIRQARDDGKIPPAPKGTGHL
jgi:hypothetical protein